MQKDHGNNTNQEGKSNESKREESSQAPAIAPTPAPVVLMPNATLLPTLRDELLPIYQADFEDFEHRIIGWLALTEEPRVRGYLTDLLNQVKIAGRVLRTPERLTEGIAGKHKTLWKCAQRKDVADFFKLKGSLRDQAEEETKKETKKIKVVNPQPSTPDTSSTVQSSSFADKVSKLAAKESKFLKNPRNGPFTYFRIDIYGAWVPYDKGLQERIREIHESEEQIGTAVMDGQDLLINLTTKRQANINTNVHISTERIITWLPETTIGNRFWPIPPKSANSREKFPKGKEEKHKTPTIEEDENLQILTRALKGLEIESKEPTKIAQIEKLMERLALQKESKEDKHDESSYYEVVPVPKDDHCLYYAVGLYVGKSVETLREAVVKEFEAKPDFYEPFLELKEGQTPKEYIAEVRKSEWAGNAEITALMVILKRPIIVVREGENVEQRINNPTTQEKRYCEMGTAPIPVMYKSGVHYDALIVCHSRKSLQVIGQPNPLVEIELKKGAMPHLVSMIQSTADQGCPQFRIKKIEFNYQPGLLGAYCVWLEALRLSLSSAQELLAYHGTDRDSAELICVEGFKTAFTREGGASGPGNYFTQHISEALDTQYAKLNKDTRGVLLTVLAAMVAPGKTAVGNRDMRVRPKLQGGIFSAHSTTNVARRINAVGDQACYPLAIVTFERR